VFAHPVRSFESSSESRRHPSSARAPSCRVGNGSGKKNAARRTEGWRFRLY
jgi:hypothetical protein